MKVKPWRLGNSAIGTKLMKGSKCVALRFLGKDGDVPVRIGCGIEFTDSSGVSDMAVVTGFDGFGPEQMVRCHRMFTAKTLINYEHGSDQDFACYRKIAGQMEEHHVIESNIEIKVPAGSIARRTYIWTPDVFASAFERTKMHFKIVAIAKERLTKKRDFSSLEEDAAEDEAPIMSLFQRNLTFHDLDMETPKIL